MNPSTAQALASLGGSLLDCNRSFRQWTEYTKEQLGSLTIFNLIDRHDLQPSYEHIASMLETRLDGGVKDIPLIVRGSFSHAPGIELQITCVRRGDSGEAMHLCITLLQNHHNPRQEQTVVVPAPPSDTKEELPAISTAGLITLNDIMKHSSLQGAYKEGEDQDVFKPCQGKEGENKDAFHPFQVIG
jgi:hypothetical protein